MTETIFFFLMEEDPVSYLRNTGNILNLDSVGEARMETKSASCKRPCARLCSYYQCGNNDLGNRACHGK